jgi:hypothetical protein
MPLVVPGITDNSGDKTQEWSNKLVGKKVTDDAHSETVSTVSSPLRHLRGQFSDWELTKLRQMQNFCKKDLPEQCRVISPGTMVTKDFRPERLNVHVKEDGTVSHVHHG